MLYISSIISILEVIIIVLPALLTVAFVTIAERKTMASMQRRLGPNIVGYYGLLQAFADALKLLLKEYVSPTQANLILFFAGPLITLIFSLLGFAVIPYGPGLTIFDFNLGIFFLLAVSSIATYGILLAGWSANSKYAFLGSLRSTAQLISYELVLSSAIFLIILLTSSLNLTTNIEAQKAVSFILPLFPIFVIFTIGAIAETNRAPFDLAEAESELVSGFMTEHSAVIFVFFFLAEYASIILICILISVLYLGGYNLYFEPFIFVIESCSKVILVLLKGIFLIFDNNVLPQLKAWFTDYLSMWKCTSIFYDINSHGPIRCYTYVYKDWVIDKLIPMYNIIISHGLAINSEDIFNYPLKENILYSMVLGIKSLFMVFVFIWVRASFPRIRFDQLMSYCWLCLIPLLFAFIVFIPCLIYILDAMPNNILFY